jgi:hypothetical protein
MKSGAGSVDHAAARQFAIDNGIVGAGWGLTDSPDLGPLPDKSDDLALYLKHAKERFPDDQSLEGVAADFGQRMKLGDYCWMYVTHTGEYWCCRIDNEKFCYRVGGDFDKFDLHITRRCTWARAGTADAVPGVVRRAFAGQFGTVSRIVTNADMAIEAAEVALGFRKPTANDDLFALASPEDLEDIVALFLQTKGWRLFPSTAKVSMASYEFVMVHERMGKRAGVQVKSGTVGYLEQKVASDFDSFFVFLANPMGVIAGDVDRISRITREEVAKFANDNWKLLPQRLKLRWSPVNSGSTDSDNPLVSSLNGSLETSARVLAATP